MNDSIINYVVCVSFAGDVKGPEIDRIFVFWSPEACIADSMTDDGLSKVVSGNTQVSWRLFGDGNTRVYQ